MTCPHGHSGSCPHDQLAQVRLRGSGPSDPWETRMVAACDAGSVSAWRSQVAPRLRRQGYETRVVRRVSDA